MCKKIKFTQTLHPSQKLTHNGSVLNVKHKIMKLLKDSIRENLGDLQLGDDFWDAKPKVWSMKKRTDNLDYIKTQNFCVKDYQESKKTSYGMGENVCKRYIWKRPMWNRNKYILVSVSGSWHRTAKTLKTS